MNFQFIFSHLWKVKSFADTFSPNKQILIFEDQLCISNIDLLYSYKLSLHKKNNMRKALDFLLLSSFCHRAVVKQDHYIQHLCWVMQTPFCDAAIANLRYEAAPMPPGERPWGWKLLRTKILYIANGGQVRIQYNLINFWSWFMCEWNCAQPCYFQNRTKMFCFPVFTFMYLWAFYIFPGSGCLFCCSQIGRPIQGIYKSLKDTWM